MSTHSIYLRYNSDILVVIMNLFWLSWCSGGLLPRLSDNAISIVFKIWHTCAESSTDFFSWVVV